jgi:molybdenum cofactor biosynthesis enzyme MoaA
MKLEDIGFYTLSDDRAKSINGTSPMCRCELLVTSACNFRCPYCRGVKGLKGHLPLDSALEILNLWINDGLQNVRFSGGEPTLYPHLKRLVALCKVRGVKRIAISSNGSADRQVYEELLAAGANDFSISLDACCASFANKMAGLEDCHFDKVAGNIRFLSERCYTTVGVVLTEDNIAEITKIVSFADSLGVHDIRVIPAAQFGKALPPEILRGMGKHRILNYRINNMKSGQSVRGLTERDSDRCHLVMDDSAVVGDSHYPCIIYLREGGKPIGKVGPDMRAERVNWAKNHNCFSDPICRGNCLDVCRDFNNKVGERSD